MFATTPRRRLRRLVATGSGGIALVAAGTLGGLAYANHTAAHLTFKGGGDVAVRVATDTSAFSTTAPNTWQNVTGSSLGYTVTGGTKLVRAEFTAETFSQAGGSWCAARVVASRAGSSTFTEFHPRANDEFAFDSSAGADNWEGHAFKRALRVGNGTYYFRVQLNAAGGGSCTVDDWYFDIEVHPGL